MPRLPSAPSSPSPLTRPALWRYGAYPLLALWTLLYLGWELSPPGALLSTPATASTPAPLGALGHHYPLYLAITVLGLAGLEARFPLNRQWRMRPDLFFKRDLPFMVLGGGTLALLNLLAHRLVAQAGLHPLQDMTSWLGIWPWYATAACAIALTDGLWYGLHRWSHRGQGPVGRMLWRWHRVHHQPQQVYVLMHAVAHPLNTALVRTLLTVPLWWLGFPAPAVFAASVITGFQGLVSHWNFDSHTPWLDPWLTGTQLHRLHHSADPAHEGNYAAVLSLWDRLGGTYVDPVTHTPVALGLHPTTEARHDHAALTPPPPRPCH